jgi:hypothetical protein
MPNVDPFTYLKLIRGDWDNGEDNFLFTVKFSLRTEQDKEDLVAEGPVGLVPENLDELPFDYRIQHNIVKTDSTSILLDDIGRMESDRLYNPGIGSRPEYLGKLVRSLMEFKV